VGAEGSEGETCIQVEGGVLLGANPRKSCNRFPNNYNALFNNCFERLSLEWQFVSVNS